MPELSDHECLAIVMAEPHNAKTAERAFDTLVHRHDGGLQRVLRSRYPWLSNEDLQDISQETWLRVWRRLDDRIGAEAFPKWLVRIGINLAIDFIRRKAILSPASLGEQEMVSVQPDLIHTLAFAEQLKRCVDKLPPNQRDFLAKWFNFDSDETIAQDTGKKIGRIYQIKSEIKKDWGAWEGGKYSLLPKEKQKSSIDEIAVEDFPPAGAAPNIPGVAEKISMIPPPNDFPKLEDDRP